MKSRRVALALSAIILTGCVVAGYGIVKNRSSQEDRIVYLSDLYWKKASIGWGELHLNRSVENGPILLDGTSYAKGIGFSGDSEIVYRLDKAAVRFEAVVGSTEDVQKIKFQVFVDEEKKFDSGPMSASTPKQSIQLSVKGASELRLVAIGQGDAGWADAKLTVRGKSELPAMTAPAGDIGDPENPKGDPYDYTVNWYPERPYRIDYRDVPFTKMYLAGKDSEQPSTKTIVVFDVEQALENMKKLDRLMLGAKKIVYLVGWQFEGHDSKYPSWATVNPALKRPQDATAADSLKWLMEEAKKYNTIVSLHINMADAYEDSPLWEEYVSYDIIAKDTDGQPKAGVDWGGQTSYQIDYKQEWETGYSKKRIDELLKLLPIQQAGTIHIDAFNSNAESHPDLPISPYLGHTLEDQEYAQRKILRYWRSKGVDVTTEFPSGNLKPDDYTGIEAGSWHSGTLDYPPYLRTDTPLENLEGQFGSRDFEAIKKTIFTNFVPWHYKNNTTKAIGLETHEDEARNFFYPALWLERTLVAYSVKGYEEKTWQLPPGWENAKNAVLSEVTPEGSHPIATVPVIDNSLTFGMTPGQALQIEAADIKP